MLMMSIYKKTPYNTGMGIIYKREKNEKKKKFLSVKTVIKSN
jgi:hypothetical protein